MDAFEEKHDITWLSEGLVSAETHTITGINHRFVVLTDVHEEWSTHKHSCMSRHMKTHMIKVNPLFLHTSTQAHTLTRMHAWVCWLGCQSSSEAWRKVMPVISCRQRKCTTSPLMWQTGRFPSSHTIQPGVKCKQRVVVWQTSVILQVLQPN